MLIAASSADYNDQGTLSANNGSIVRKRLFLPAQVPMSCSVSKASIILTYAHLINGGGKRHQKKCFKILFLFYCFDFLKASFAALTI